MSFRAAAAHARFAAPALVACLALLAPTLAAAQPPADALARLAAYDPARDDLSAVLQAVTPGLARHFLQLAATTVHKGGPLAETLGAGLAARLDARPGDLPLVVFRKEDRRLPGAFIVARYRNVRPEQLLVRMGQRPGIVRHPLVAEYRLLAPLAAAPAWSAGGTRRTARAFYAVDMPFGAGLFGLRPSYVFGDWDFVQLANGVCIAAFAHSAPSADEYGKLRTFKDKDGGARILDTDYHRAREYRLTSLLLPERDESGVVRHTVHVYFVRIVPGLDDGTTLQGTGALGRWLFARGATEALVEPIKLIRRQLGQ